MSKKDIATAILKQNQRYEEYYVKVALFEKLRDGIKDFIKPQDKGADEALATMSTIDTHMSNIEDFFVEVGYLAHYDDTEIDEYKIHRIERRIASGLISILNDVPKEYRDQFENMFGHDSNERPRPWEDIDADICREIRQIEENLLLSNDFSKYMPSNRTKTSAKLEEVRTILNNIWDEYYDAAIDRVTYFRSN